MGRNSGRLRQEVLDLLIPSGASAIGFSEPREIIEEEARRFALWIEKGFHGSMTWLERHRNLRLDPDNVLPGTKSIISLAFSYAPSQWRDTSLPGIAAYAYGEDYHLVLRERLESPIDHLKQLLGGDWRICIDSAPIPERFWAINSGIATPCINGTVSVPGVGSLCFLVEVLTTIEIPEYFPWFSSYPNNDDSLNIDQTNSHYTPLTICTECGLCVAECPGAAIRGDGTIDSRRCVSYLTIEHKEEFTDEERAIIAKAGNPLAGCDRCLRVCPLNIGLAPTPITEFHPHEVPSRRSPLTRALRRKK